MTRRFPHTRATAFLAGALALIVLPHVSAAQSSAPAYDIILRGGTVVDGTGGPRRRADVAITRGHIARVGDLARATARTEIDVRGLFVAPGFLNIHSHANPGVLPTAENMLTQGVTRMRIWKVLNDAAAKGVMRVRMAGTFRPERKKCMAPSTVFM